MKKVLMFFSMLLIANNNFAEEKLVTENTVENIQQPVEQKPQKIIIDVKSVYDSLNIKDKIDYSIFQKAYLGYVQILNKNPGVLIIIDYSKPSNEERFYDFMEEELTVKIQNKPKSEKNKVIKTN